MSPLKKMINQNLNLTLPKGLGVSDIKYFSVWSRQYDVDFGHVEFYKHYTASAQTYNAERFMTGLLVFTILSLKNFIL